MKLFKKLFYPLLVLFSCKEVKNKPSEILNSSMSIYEIKIKTIEGKDLSLSDFKGKKILFVKIKLSFDGIISNIKTPANVNIIK